MESLLQKLIASEKLTDINIEDYLLEICKEQGVSRAHAEHPCNYRCPVYYKNDGDTVSNNDKFPHLGKSQNYCGCFMSGRKMLEFLRP